MENKVNSYIIRSIDELEFICKYLNKEYVDEKNSKILKTYINSKFINIIIYEKGYLSKHDGDGFYFENYIGYDHLIYFYKNKKLLDIYNIIEVKDLIRLTKLKKIYGTI